MELLNITRPGLVDFTVAQITHFFPDGRDDIHAPIAHHCGEALVRLNRCINAARLWPKNKFDYLHSSQYCTYLYFLANTIWRNSGNVHVCTKVFLLNKALNAIDCFYEVDLPDVFFIGHSPGIVLAKASYANYLVLYQNSTVGKNHGVAPVIEEGVVMYPNSAIIGRCHIGARTVLAQGTGVIDQNTPGDVIAFHSDSGKLVFKPTKRDILADLFRI
jgi:serine O-acetyltransferase